MRPRLPDGYAVEFRYEAVLSKRPPKGEDGCVETLRTVALIGPSHRRFAAAQGEAILNPGDSFSMHVAQEVALGRAIKALDGPRGPMEETVLALAKERFASAQIHRSNGGKPFVVVNCDASDDSQWDNLADFYESLDQHGLRTVANVVLTTS